MDRPSNSELTKGNEPPVVGGDSHDAIVTRLANEDKVPWYRKPNLRHLYFMLIPTCMGIQMTSGFHSQMVNAMQILPSWISFFGNPQSTLKGIIAAAYPLGAIFSLPLIPVINDRLGRRWAIFLGSSVLVAGSLIQGFANNVGAYIAARLILGFGIPPCIVSGSSLIGELGYPNERAVLTSLFSVSFFIGQITAAGICFGTNGILTDWGWRVPSLLQIVCPLLQLIFVFFLPESPRWLVAKDRSDEAHQILRKYHAEGRDSQFVRAEMAQIQSTLRIEMRTSRTSWLDLAATAGMRKRLLTTCMLGLFAQWSGSTLLSYYLGDLLQIIGRDSSHFKQTINVTLSCWSLVCSFTASMFVRRFKRRHMYLACTASLLVVFTGYTISMERAITARESGQINNAAGTASIFFIYAYAPCYCLALNTLTYTFLVELWPYTERSHGISVFQLFSRSAEFFTTFVNPIGLNNIGWRFLITYCCFLAFEVYFVYFHFPETSGKTLEEATFLFEDEKAAEVQAIMAVENSIAHEMVPGGSRGPGPQRRGQRLYV
ncbi:general substrate transporter [Canariomyces notabilis]|uniref:General substrate transporter n=1 Tax=Canariomyces notabilis TaxID=2074819 RepID=A0AAN6TKP8_9PEZI|nr:general substrate transporter [Canariomyces arenarius]